MCVCADIYIYYISVTIPTQYPLCLIRPSLLLITPNIDCPTCAMVKSWQFWYCHPRIGIGAMMGFQTLWFFNIAMEYRTSLDDKNDDLPT